jgi:nucleotide-binding universal stress UspA family protein
MFKHILVPTDGSDITHKAVDTAISLAQKLGARITGLSVEEPFPYAAISEMQPVPPQEFLDVQERLAKSHLVKIEESCAAAGVAFDGQCIEAAHPWEAIIELAKTAGCDLIIMASHGRRGLSAVLLGSETQKVLTHSKLPVTVVR